MSAQPVDRKHSQREQNPLAQVRDAEDVRQLPPDWKYALLSHYCKTSTLPPALVIFSVADLENLCACTVMAMVSSPSPRIFTGCLALITPALRSTSGVMGAACISSPSATSRSRLTMLNSLRKMLVKPRFGMRRCSGIWPPSKPRIMREPVRERWPLCPRVDVLPMPEPMPRPTRLRFSDAFFGARMLDKFINKLSAISSQRKTACAEADGFLLQDLDQMRNLSHHAANRCVVWTLNHLVQPGKSQSLDHKLMFHRCANGRDYPLQVYLSGNRLRFLRRHRKSLSSVSRYSVLGTWY